MAKLVGAELMTPDDRERLNELLDEGIGTKDKRGFSGGVLRDLRDDESVGDDSARRILDAMACNGLFTELGKRATRETGVFKDESTGRVLNVPKIGSIPVLAMDGTSTGARQLKLWQDMTRAEFSVWLDQQGHHAESLRFKVRGLQRVLKEWEQYPDASNARDVCELAGIDPDELDLERAA